MILLSEGRKEQKVLENVLFWETQAVQNTLGVNLKHLAVAVSVLLLNRPLQELCIFIIELLQKGNTWMKELDICNFEYWAFLNVDKTSCNFKC